jgi:hypothetical protein
VAAGWQAQVSPQRQSDPHWQAWQAQGSQAQGWQGHWGVGI